MSYFVNLRGSAYGAVVDGYVLQGDVTSDPPGMVSVPYETVPSMVKNKHVLLVAHGFNVNYVNGLRSLGRLADLIAPTSAEVVLGVLWPGDWVIPAINYPFSEKIATQSGKKLAAFCDSWLSGAASLSFASHSLGARVVLQAVAQVSRKARTLCITAGAVSADCLTAEYAAAAANARTVVTLSSMMDLVLEYAYPPGDLIADILDLDHNPFERAVGREGPDTPLVLPSFADQIPDASGYDHGDYLPTADLGAAFPDPAAKWAKSSAFIANAFRGRPQTLPSA